MTNIPPIHQRFNIKIDFEEAKQRFVNRAYNEIFNNDSIFTPGVMEKREVLRCAATALGRYFKPNDSFYSVVGEDFLDCLQAIEGIFNTSRRILLRDSIESTVKELIASSPCDLGIKWENGHFSRTGAKLLDDVLVNENLKWLEDPGLKHIHKPFNKGLLLYSESIRDPEKLSDVVTDMYEALEATAKWFLKNGKDLSGNQQEFINRLGLPSSYGRMLKEYIDYANQLARHAKNPEKSPYKIPPSEAENFIYLTGLFIRLAIKKSEEK